MGKFGQVLKKYRELKNISKVKLAKSIGTSDAYIRQIENQGYKPPTFDLCQKISFELSLNELEKKELLETAFIERISSEEQFYNILKKDVFKINETVKNTITIYFQPLISSQINSNILKIREHLTDSINKLPLTVENIAISNHSFCFQLSTSINDETIQQVESFMELSSKLLQNEFNQLDSVPTVWKKEFLISEIAPNSINSLSTTLEYAAKL